MWLIMAIPIFPHDCVVDEYDADEQHSLPKGFIDDANNQ